MVIRNATCTHRSSNRQSDTPLHDVIDPPTQKPPVSLLVISGALGLYCVLYPGRPSTLLAIAIYAGLTSALGFDYASLFAYGLSALYVVNHASVGVPVGILVGAAIFVGSILASLGSKKISGRRLHPTLFLAIAVALYSYIRSPSTHAGAVSSFSLIFLPLAIALILSLRQTKFGSDRSVNWFVLGLSLAVGRALLTAYQHISGDYVGYEDIRIFTSGIGSSNYAAALAMVTGLTVAFAPASTMFRKKLCWALSIPFLLAPFVFASRGAIIALGATLLITFFRFSAKKKTINVQVFAPLALIVASLLFAIVASHERYFFWQRFVDPANVSSGYLAGRVQLWRFTTNLIQQQPYLGTAPGRLTDELLSGFSFAYPHQFFLGVAAQIGIFAGGVYIYMVRPRPMRWSPLAPALIAICINSTVEPVLSTPAGAAIGAGLVVAHGIACQRGRSDG